MVTVYFFWLVAAKNLQFLCQSLSIRLAAMINILNSKGHRKIKFCEANKSMQVSRQQLSAAQLRLLLDIDGLCVRQHVTLLCAEVWL
jgi:hypothetical protein